MVRDPRVDVVERRTTVVVFSLLLVASAAFAVVPTAAASSTLVVDANGEAGSYTSVQAAVDAATPGDTVEVRPGTYAESVTVGTANVSVVGEPGVVIAGNATGVDVTAPNVSLRAVTTTNVSVADDDTTVRNVTVANGSDTGLELIDADRVTVAELTVQEGYEFGVSANRSDGLTLESIATENTTIGLAVRQGSGLDVRGATFSGEFGRGERGITVANATAPSFSNVTTYRHLLGVRVANSTGVVIDDAELNGGGLGVRDSRNVTIREPTVSDAATTGLGMVSVRNGSVRNGSFERTGGVSIFATGNVTFRDNSVTDSGPDSFFLGSPVEPRNDIDRSNTVDGDPIYHLVGADDRVVEGGDPAAVFVLDSDNLTVRNQSLDGTPTAVTGWNASFSVRNVSVRDSSSGVAAHDGALSLRDVRVNGSVTGIVTRNTTTTARNLSIVDPGDIGGINDIGIDASDGVTTLRNVTITGQNTGIGGSTVTLRNSTVAVSNLGIDAERSLTVSNSSVRGLETAVGGVNATVTISNSSLDGGSAVAAGRSTVTVRDSAITADSIGIDVAYGALTAEDVTVDADFSGISADGTTVSIDGVVVDGGDHAVDLWEIDGTVRDLTTRNSADGLTVAGASHDLTVVESRFENYSEFGVAVDRNAHVATISLHNSSFDGSGEYAVRNDNFSADLDARYNWWGDASGPEIEVFDGETMRTTGDGGAVSPSVEFRPWSGVVGPEPSLRDTVVSPNESIRVEAEARNGHAKNVSYNVTVTADGGTVNTTRVTLASSESRSLSENVSFETLGEHTVGVNGQQVNVTVEAAGSDDGGSAGDGSSGGGGAVGGGGGQPSGDEVSVDPVDTSEGATITVSDAGNGDTFSADVPGTSGAGITVSELGFEMTFATDGFRVEATEPTDSPQGADALDGAEAVGYFRLDAVQFDQSNLDTASVSVELSESALPEGADPADVTLYRYHDGEWQALETTAVGDGVFEAETPGFSAFAVGVDSGGEPTPTATATPEPDTETATAAATATATPTEDEPTTTDSPGFGALTALAALFAVAVVARRRRR